MVANVEEVRCRRWSFTEHPASVGETYLEHLTTAWSFSGRLALASLACLLHGLLPFTLPRTGSSIVGALYERMVAKRVRTGAAAPRLTARVL